MKIIKVEVRENWKAYFTAVCLFALLCGGFLVHRKYNPLTIQFAELGLHQ